MKTVTRLSILVFALLTFSACEKDEYQEDEVVGLWQQVLITEDGVPMVLTPEQESCKLLIESNGVCRYYHQSFIHHNNGAGPTRFYGTWSMLDGEWINFTTEKWQLIAPLTSDSNKVVISYLTDANDSIIGIDTLKTVQKQWNPYHIQSRFTILRLTGDELEIRLKTFVGEKKYALLFAPEPADFLELKTPTAGKPIYIPKLVTDENYWAIRKEFQTLKTYVFKFRKTN